MSKHLWLRNVLVMVGGYYLASWVLVPFWIPIAKLAEGRVYQPGWESFVMNAFNTIPVACGAVLAGMASGYFLDTEKPTAWAIGVGVFVGICNWSTARWYVTPSVADLLAQGAHAAVTGSLAFAACWTVQRRRRDVKVPSAAA
jgi:hypothetical protein